ncbi:hypothetical protein LXL04_002414 [Taraxacum kok-saghyz]
MDPIFTTTPSLAMACPLTECPLPRAAIVNEEEELSLSRVSNDIIAPGTVYPQSSPSHQVDL